MSLISDIFQQNQQIAQNPAQVIRTPQQVAYDNLLNKQYDIEQQNKNYNLYNGLASGIGGLGKILASTFVKNPYQQAGAMKGISEQEQRLDNLRNAYEIARQAQNKDYVQQAKDQLDMARADEDKDYKKSIDERDFNFRQNVFDKEYDLKQLAQNIAQKQWEKEFGLKRGLTDAQIKSINAQIKANGNKPAELTPEEKIALKVKEEDAIAQAKAKREAQQEANRAKADYEAFKGNIDNLKALAKASGTTASRALGGVASVFDSITGKGGSLTNPNIAMDELLAQLRQAALSASGISGESDDKAQQAKINDIYQRAGIPKNAKSLSPSQVNGIINNIENIYKQRLAGKQNLLNSFNDFSATWE